MIVVFTNYQIHEPYETVTFLFSWRLLKYLDVNSSMTIVVISSMTYDNHMEIVGHDILVLLMTIISKFSVKNNTALVFFTVIIFTSI